MTISEKDWNSYIRKLRKLSDTVADKVKAYIERHGLENTKELIDYSYALVSQYGEGAAALSAQMYDILAELEGRYIEPAEMAPTATYGEVAKSVNGTLKTSQNPNEISGAVSRWVKMAGSDTTLKNAQRDGAQFAWIPSGDTCAFCLTLASRGWQNMSKAALKHGHAEHIHSHCDCQYAVRFDSKSTVAGYDPDRYRQMYDEAEGDTPQEKINAIRRAQYEENKDMIKAQKRAAYAEKKAKEVTNRTANKKTMKYGDITHEESPKSIEAGGSNNDVVMSSTQVEFEGKRIYISDKIIEDPDVIMDKIEPCLKAALDDIGRDHGELPNFIIADITELSHAEGRYLYDSNTVVLVPILFGDVETMEIHNMHVSYHELMHWCDCQEMAKKHPGLKEDDLVDHIIAWAKDELDKAGIDEYSILEETKYAIQRYDEKRYDETYVEYRVKRMGR